MTIHPQQRKSGLIYWEPSVGGEERVLDGGSVVSLPSPPHFSEEGRLQECFPGMTVGEETVGTDS